MEYAIARSRTIMHPATFCLFNSDQKHNPLHLAINKKNKDIYFQEITENAYVIVVRSSCELLKSDNKPCLCVNVVILDSGLNSTITSSTQSTCQAEFECGATNSEEDGNGLTLFCTSKFLDHYHLRDNKVYYVQKISPPTLTKVTLAATNSEVFSWTNSQLFSTGLLVNVCNQYQVLACKDDKFSIPYSDLFEGEENYAASFLTDLHVVDTEPFHQGIITLKTEFIVLNKTLLQVEPTLDEDETNTDKKPFATHISDFSVPLTSVFIPRLINKPVLWSDKQHSIALQRDWHLLPCQLLTTLGPMSEDTVLGHSIYVNLSTAKKCGLFNDSLIEIQAEPKSTPQNVQHEESVIITGEAPSPQNQAKKPVKVCRVVHVKILPTESDLDEDGEIVTQCNNMHMDDILFVTISLWHNLHRQHNKPIIDETLIRFRKHQPELQYISSSSASWDGRLLYAKEVHISCVNSPQYSTGASFKNTLQKYFNIPRTLQQGDVFAVDTKVDIEFSQSSEGVSTSNPVVYFRVKRISPRSSNKQRTYLVSSDHTVLIQDGPCHSYVPSCLESLLCDAQKAIVMPGLQHHLQNLAQLIQPYLEKWTGETETVPMILLHGASGCGKMSVCQATATAANMHFFKVNCHDLCGETSSATEARILQYIMRACMYSPCVLQLNNIHALGKDRDGNNEDARVASYFHECIHKVLHQESPDWPVVVIATTLSLKHLTSDMHAGFLHTLEIEVPNEATRTSMLQSLLFSTPCSSTLSMRKIAQRTAGFVLGDLVMLVARAKKEAYKDVLHICFPSDTTPTIDDEYNICICGPCLHQKHCDTALDDMQAAHCDAIGAPKIPDVTWDDVGGLATVKADILDTIQLPLQHPELFAAGLRRSGLLLFGPPGTGKTLLAKAVATECSLNFLSVKGPELINMYVGQSEENIREVFSRARNATPCVIFFDELDSLAPNRGRSGDSGGVMDRVVSQLLAELDGLHKSCDVFVIGATNRPDLLDPALLRPGRFDKLLYLGVSEDKSSQLKILKALTRKFKLASSCSLSNIVERCPLHMTGADFYALCSDAMLNALKSQIHKLETGNLLSDETVQICAEDFYQALINLVPSVSEEELQRYEYLKRTLTAGK